MSDIRQVMEVMRYNDAVRRAFAELYRWQMRGLAIAEAWQENLELDMPALNEVDAGIQASRDAVTAALREAGVVL